MTICTPHSTTLNPFSVVTVIVTITLCKSLTAANDVKCMGLVDERHTKPRPTSRPAGLAGVMAGRVHLCLVAGNTV